MRTSRRLQLRLAASLAAALDLFAEERGLPPAAAARMLLRTSLDGFATKSGEPVDSAVALAALVAAEHAVLMVAAVLPDGQRRMQVLAAEAAAAAEERQATFRPGEQ